MNFSKNIEKIKAEQEKLVDSQKSIKKEIATIKKPLKKYVQQRWDETFPGTQVHFLASLEGGCFTNEWNAEVYFYTINNIEHCQGNWYQYSNDWQSAEKVLPPISTKKLIEFLSELSKEIGLKCELVNSKYAKHKAENPRERRNYLGSEDNGKTEGS